MPDSPRFVLVTGLSGAGKSTALQFLEDLGYYCVDNLPAPLIPKFSELVFEPEINRKRVAVCVDARTTEGLANLPAYLDMVAGWGVRAETLFLESSDDVLIHRYSESRRRHPCAPTGSIEEGIRRERALLERIRARADLVVDTSATPVAELRERVASMFSGPRERPELVVTVLSFGFKHGVPQEADLVFDVRFLPNPHYDPELRPRTGDDPEVRDYVLENPYGVEFINRVQGLLKFLLPRYEAEPKSYLTIAVGCTGGRHRSVAVAHALTVYLRTIRPNVRLHHRDLSDPGDPA